MEGYFQHFFLCTVHTSAERFSLLAPVRAMTVSNKEFLVLHAHIKFWLSGNMFTLLFSDLVSCEETHAYEIKLLRPEAVWDNWRLFEFKSKDLDEEIDFPVKKANSVLIADDAVEVLLGVEEILIKEQILEMRWYMSCLI